MNSMASQEKQENHLLAELRRYPHWVCYRSTEDKAPRQIVHPELLASIVKPSDWATYEEAATFRDANPIYGLGFVLTKSLGISCIDLDATDDKTNLDRHAQIYKKLFPTAYAELSPSGHGAHLWVRGSVATRKASKLKIEVYSGERYMTVTGNALPGRNVPLPVTQGPLEELIAAVDRLSPRKAPAPVTADFPECRTDDEVRELVQADSLGAALWAGKWHDGSFPSQSEADGKLAVMIARESGNQAQTQRLFMESGLGKRDKAKRPDYQRRTLDVEYPPVLPLSTLAAFDEAWKKLQEKQRNPRTRIVTGINDIPLLSEYGDVPTDYIIPDFLVGNAVTLITGTYGGGKSTITSVFAEAISTGGEFLDRQCKQREVLYLDRENPLGTVKNRFANFKLNQDNKNFHYFGQFTGSEVPLPSTPWIVEWAQSLKEAPVIVVDGFTAFLDGGNENDPAITRAWFNSLRPLIKAGCAVVVFHHTGKGDSTKPFRGGTDIAAAIDNGFMLESTYDANNNFDELILTSFNKMRYKVDPKIEFSCVDGIFIPKQKVDASSVLDRSQLYELLQKADGWSKRKFEDEAMKQNISQLKARTFLNNAFAQKAIRYDDGPHKSKVIRLVATVAC